MNKIKTTKKAMKESFNKIIAIGYCNAQNLLHYEDAYTYCTRAEGWACDNYAIDNVLISTGYAPIASKNITNCNYELVNKYDLQAEKIINNYELSYEQKKKLVKALLNEFVLEATKD